MAISYENFREDGDETVIRINKEPTVWGFDATGEMAVACAEGLGEAILERWPEVEIQYYHTCGSSSASGKSYGPLADEIEAWIERNWIEVADHALLKMPPRRSQDGWRRCAK